MAPRVDSELLLVGSLPADSADSWTAPRPCGSTRVWSGPSVAHNAGNMLRGCPGSSQFDARVASGAAARLARWIGARPVAGWGRCICREIAQEVRSQEWQAIQVAAGDHQAPGMHRIPRLLPYQPS